MKIKKMTFLLLSPLSLFASNNFLNKNELPNLIKIIPSPPTINSTLYLNDVTISKATFFEKNKLRYELAKKDAIWNVDGLAQAFSDAFGFPINKKDTPTIYNIIKQVLIYAHDITVPIKGYYHRTRPFYYFHEKSCTPNDEKHLNGAYPSGHTTAGWCLALILSEINPSNANQIMKRGYDFGQSRVICGVHWPSDVESGYLAGSILFSKLQTSKDFQNEIEIAKKEIKSHQNKN